MGDYLSSAPHIATGKRSKQSWTNCSTFTAREGSRLRLSSDGHF
jgi:hypothetical protein